MSEPKPTSLDCARDDVRAALARLPGWHAGRPTYREESDSWLAAAYCGQMGDRRYSPGMLEASGATEAEALARLARMLQGRADAG
jgi:hypothetical protein